MESPVTFEAVVKKLDLVRAVVIKGGMPDEVADDVINEVALAAKSSLRTYDPARADLGTWLCGVLGMSSRGTPANTTPKRSSSYRLPIRTSRLRRRPSRTASNS